MATRETYSEVARLLRIRLADQPSHVVVARPGMAGQWLEIQRGDFYFLAGDNDGMWGVTTFTAKPNGADGTFEHGFENMPITAYWLHNRTDGPDGEKATPSEVMQYLISVGVASGVPDYSKAYFRIEARPSRWNGDASTVDRLIRESGIEHTLVGQRQLIDGTDAFMLQLVADRIPLLEAYLRRFTGEEFRIGSLDWMRSSSQFLDDTLSDAPSKVVRYVMHDVDSYSTAMRKLGELRRAVDPATLTGLNVYGVPFFIHGVYVHEDTKTADLMLVVPRMSQDVVSSVIAKAGLTSTYTAVPIEGR